MKSRVSAPNESPVVELSPRTRANRCRRLEAAAAGYGSPEGATPAGGPPVPLFWLPPADAGGDGEDAGFAGTESFVADVGLWELCFEA